MCLMFNVKTITCRLFGILCNIPFFVCSDSVAWLHVEHIDMTTVMKFFYQCMTFISVWQIDNKKNNDIMKNNHDNVSNNMFYLFWLCFSGEEIKLSEEAEEVAGFYARMIEHDYTTKDVFNNNFFRDWKKVQQISDIFDNICRNPFPFCSITLWSESWDSKGYCTHRKCIGYFVYIYTSRSVGLLW